MLTHLELNEYDFWRGTIHLQDRKHHKNDNELFVVGRLMKRVWVYYMDVNLLSFRFRLTDREPLAFTYSSDKATARK